MKINLEIWENEIYKSKRKSVKNQTTNFLMFGTSLEGLKGKINYEKGLEQCVYNFEKSFLSYALACPIKNLNV